MNPFVAIFTGPPGCGKSTLAERVSLVSGAPVANWDWLMSGLRVFPDVWTPIEADAERRRDVGYSLMCRIGEQQLVVDALDPVQQNHAAVARHLGLADLD